MLPDLVAPRSTIAPRIHLGDWADSIVTWLTDHWTPLFDGIASVLSHLVGWIQQVLMSPPVILVVIVLAAIALLARGWKFAIVSVIGFVLIDGFDMFPSTMETLSQILVASVIAIAIAVPVGILAARWRPASVVVRPVLDFMQTLPAYVYLLPALFLMGLGAPGAIVATIIFAMPPGVRLTELGIRQVDQELVEAGESFGAKPSAVLRGIQFPLAMPTIMAGINQVIMLALSMVVIGGLVGAPGLGRDVTSALQTLDIGTGVEAGVSVVILAIFLDRVTDGFSKKDVGLRIEVGRLRRAVRSSSATA